MVYVSRPPLVVSRPQCAAIHSPTARLTAAPRGRETTSTGRPRHRPYRCNCARCRFGNREMKIFSRNLAKVIGSIPQRSTWERKHETGAGGEESPSPLSQNAVDDFIHAQGAHAPRSGARRPLRVPPHPPRLGFFLNAPDGFEIDFPWRLQQRLRFLGEDAGVQPVVEVLAAEGEVRAIGPTGLGVGHFLRQDRLRVAERIPRFLGEPGCVSAS